MPRFRYESVDAGDVPIHGILDADSESHLRALLQRRGQRLVSAQPKTVLGSEGDVTDRLPRMVQLRVGESLRAAFLTQIPAQDALRAAAREPLLHPLAGLFPWLMGMGLFLLLPTGLHAVAIGSATTPLLIGLVVVLVLIPGAWWRTDYYTRTRPRTILNRLADRLDAGDSDMTSFASVMAEPERTIASAQLDHASKCCVLAELASRPSVTGWGRHRFAVSLLGSFVLMFAAVMAVYGFLMVPVPAFNEIFESFDLELPSATLFVLRISDSFRIAGLFGLVTLCLLGVAGFACLYGLLYRGWGAAHLQSVPVLGTGLKWANLARVGRLLAVLIRNDCPPAESLRIATGQKQATGTADEGARLADRIEEQHWIDGAGSALDGLPVSLLLSMGTTPEHRRRRAVAASTFDGLASMFEQSVQGYGTIVSVCVQMGVVLFVMGTMGLILFAVFLPIVQLLNDLS